MLVPEEHAELACAHCLPVEAVVHTVIGMAAVVIVEELWKLQQLTLDNCHSPGQVAELLEIFVHLGSPCSVTPTAKENPPLKSVCKIFYNKPTFKSACSQRLDCWCHTSILHRNKRSQTPYKEA